MKKTPITTENFAQDLFNAQESVRKFKFAFPGTPEKSIKAYKAAKKKVAQLLTHKSNQK